MRSNYNDDYACGNNSDNGSVLFPAAPEVTFKLDDVDREVSVLSPLSFSLQCIAKGRPTPQVTWYQSGTKIISTDTISKYDRGEALTLDTIEASDIVLYKGVFLIQRLSNTVRY